MILTCEDFHICEEDTEIFRAEISNQFHLLGFEKRDFETLPKL